MMPRAAAIALLPVLLALSCRAQTLRWAADSQSGAPYVFHDPGAPGRLTGYETDLIRALAARLHRPDVFVQNDWDGLIPGLERGLYDVVIDGLDITPEHRAAVDFTDPYYTTFEQLVVRKGDERWNSLDALGRRPIATLKASLAERVLRARPGATVVTYEEETDAYADLKHHRVDAVLLDYPIALYYAAPDPRLALVGAPVARSEYGIAVAKGHPALVADLNTALAALIADGTLRTILQRWNLFTPMMQSRIGGAAAPAAPPSEYIRFVRQTAQPRGVWPLLARYAGFLPLIAAAALMTLEVSLCAMVLAVLAGLALALARLYGRAPLPQAALAYVEIVRGTPLLIQILFIFYGLPGLGLRLPPFLAGVIALGLNYSAYEAENYRAGLQAVPRGQSEAALALNMTHGQMLRHVVLPQALRIVVPVMTNDFISLLKDSSLVSIITLTELSATYVRLSTTYYDYFGTGLEIGAAYLLLGLPFVRLSRWAERRLAGARSVS